MKLPKANKDYLKDTLFETLVNYYVKYEIHAKLWVEFVETDEMSTRFRNDYLTNWKEVQFLQRFIGGILFDFRHPLSGVKIDIKTWTGYSLHHWLTAEGHENKYTDLFSSLIGLPKEDMIFNGFTIEGHTTITRLVEQGYGIKWYKIFKSLISDVSKGVAPKRWYEVVKNDLGYSEFGTYQEENEETRKLILWFLLYPQKNLMKELEILTNDIEF